MHHPHAPTKRRLFKTALCAVAAAVLLGLAPSNAAAAPAIERFPAYRPQTTCSPKPKPGTVMLARHLMRRYKGSGSLGISRSCRSGGVSEHKEGRAFDWALDAGSRRDRHHARHFLHRLRKPDRLGRRGALARRMGVMYAIWDDHIYSATYHYKKRRYLNAGCRTIRRCPVSLRHRNHMHISLTRAAAHKKTSWYSKHRVGPSKHGPSKHKVKPKKRHHKKAKADKPRRHHKARHHKARHHKARHHKVRHHKHVRHHKKARHHKHARHHKRARHHKHARHHKRARHHKVRHHEKARQHKKARPHRSKARHHKKVRRHSHARHHKARPHKARHHKHARHHKKARHHRRHRR